MKNARIMIIIQAALMYVAHIFFFTVFFIDIPKGENNSVGLLLLGIVGAIMLHAAMKKAQNRTPDAVLKP